MSEIISIDRLPGRTVTHEGKPYLFFSGTAYLGLPQLPAFQQLIQDELPRYGSVFGSSRNGNVRLSVYEEAEAKLAGFTGSQAALTVSSGMLAGQVVVNWLRGQGVQFVYAPGAHPALWHEPNVRIPARPFAEWAAHLPKQLRTLPPGPVAILTNSVEAVRSEYYEFDWLSTLPDDRSITVIVDDSHGLGVLNGGKGIWSELAQHSVRSSVNVLVTASLAKAMGLPGGVIFGDAETLQTIRRTAFFGACSPMPPGCLAAFQRADALYAQGFARLRENIQLVEEVLLPTGLFRHAAGYPVFFTDRDDLYAYLLQQNILIYSFAYPTAADRANTRIVISAFHTPDDIHQLSEAVRKFV